MHTTAENQSIETKLVEALEALTHADVSRWPAMFTEDGVQEFPYAPEGYPKRLEGKAAIAAYLADYPKKLKLHRINRPTFHHSDGVTVAEFSVEGQAVQTGNPYNQQYISVIEHRDGLITRYVDYWNPQVAADAMGGGEALQAFGNKTA